MHGPGESQSQKSPAVQVDEACGISEQGAVGPINIRNVACPDLVDVRDLQTLDPVWEHKIPAHGGLWDKPSGLDAQAVFKAMCLKSVLSPAQQHRIVPLVLVPDVKVHFPGTGARQKIGPHLPRHLQDQMLRRPALLSWGKPSPSVEGLAGNVRRVVECFHAHLDFVFLVVECAERSSSKFFFRLVPSDSSALSSTVCKNRFSAFIRPSSA